MPCKARALGAFWIGAFTLLAGASTVLAFDAKEKSAIDTLVSANVDGLSPGLAVGIVQGGEIVYEGFAGYADLDHRIEIGPTTRFNIASNAKQFTALCVLNLIDGGQLGLADDIRQHLPELYSDLDAPISIAHLISHTSGIRDVYDLWALQGKTWWKTFVDNDDALELLRAQTGLNFEPGTKHSYSNSNYILLAEIIARVTEESFAHYSTRYFEELGMSETTFHTNYMARIPNRARPYGNWSGWREYPSITGLHGDGALYSTLRDQLRWERIVQSHDSEAIDTANVRASQSPVPGIEVEDYGYGLEFGNHLGLDYRHHEGNTGAFSAFLARFPEDDLSVVVMSNSGSVSSRGLALECAEILLEGRLVAPTYPAGPESVRKASPSEDLLGDYRNESGTIIRIAQVEGGLQREISDRDPVRLLQEEGDLYRYETNEKLKMSFSSAAEGQGQFTIFHPNQEPAIYRKLPDAPIESNYPSTLDGRYTNAETGAEFSLAHVEGKSYELHWNGRKREATLLHRDLLSADGYDLRVIRTASGAIEAIEVDGGRIARVDFRRQDEDS